jgi:plastocyanin
MAFCCVVSGVSQDHKLAYQRFKERGEHLHVVCGVLLLMLRANRWILLLAYLIALRCAAQGVDVSLRVQFRDAANPLRGDTPVVVWLSPLDGAIAPARPMRTYKMEQKNKKFVPHLLVVPVGSTVEFPNLDPFFHNVFSLFNGRRFDLGLYETGKSQSVKFSREGVSYIFCNIHPEMGGIILSLTTPYYALASAGISSIRGVPPGSYKLGVWSERASTESLAAAARTFTVAAGRGDGGLITLELSPLARQIHQNKFGERYPFE